MCPYISAGAIHGAAADRSGCSPAQFDFRFYTHFSCDGSTKIFQGTTARPLYGDYGTDLDVRAGLGYMWGHYYVGASFSYGLVRLTKSDFGVKRGRLISATVGYDF